MRWPACKKHDGKHLDVHGQCVHPGAPCALRPARCAECGAATMRRLDLQTGEVSTIEAGSDLLHQHAAPIRVELDADSLAAALLRGSRQAREARQQQERQPIVVANASHRNGTHREPLGGIPELGE